MTADQLLERSDLVVGGVVDAVDAESGGIKCIRRRRPKASQIQITNVR
ncbi:MAG: hypothetical protein WB946_03950 [Halobacteriota archaeon]